MGFIHMVLMKIRSDVSADKIDDLYVHLSGLQAKIHGLVAFSGGPYDSHEGLNKGFTHAFMMEFATRADRDNYLPHPDHEVVKNMVLALVDDVIAFDYHQHK